MAKEDAFQAKVHKVMSEHKAGKLRSGSGGRVKNRKQAIAIALSEARRKTGKKRTPSRSSKRG